MTATQVMGDWVCTCVFSDLPFGSKNATQHPWHVLSTNCITRPVADLEGVEPLPPPLGRRTGAVTVFLISDNATALWRRHNQL